MRSTRTDIYVYIAFLSISISAARTNYVSSTDNHFKLICRLEEEIIVSQGRTKLRKLLFIYSLSESEISAPQ